MEARIFGKEYWAKGAIIHAYFIVFECGVEMEGLADGGQVWEIKTQTRHCVFTFDVTGIYE